MRSEKGETRTIDYLNYQFLRRYEGKRINENFDSAKMIDSEYRPKKESSSPNCFLFQDFLKPENQPEFISMCGNEGEYF
jgi:hypothetical protein